MKPNPWARPDLEPKPAPLLQEIPQLLLTDLELRLVKEAKAYVDEANRQFEATHDHV